MANYWKEGDPIYYREGNQKIYKYRVRYGEGEGSKPPYDYFVCQHLKPEGEEQVWGGWKDHWRIGDMLAHDPGWANNYQVRYCQACRNEFDAEKERIQGLMPMSDELRGYLLGLEDGYVQSKLEASDVTHLDFVEFDEMHKKAQEFADTQGKQFYHRFVETANFNPDGTRSRGWSPAPGAAPRKRYSAEQLRWEGSAVVPKSSPNISVARRA